MENSTSHQFRFSTFELDRTKRLLSRNGQPVTLNPKAFDLLLALVEARGEVLTKDELLEKVWPDQIIEEGNLKVHVSALRKALGQRGHEHRFIVTVPGRGYSFVADLEDASNDEIVVERRSYSQVIVENDETQERDRRLSTRSLVYRALAAGSILVLVAIGFAYWYGTQSPNSDSIESIAVMPFVNESGNSDLEYLSDGMTESLINSLSSVPNLSVKARSSLFRYKGKEIQPREIGSDLNVQAILSGRFVERNDQFTLYLSLVDARTGDQIWGDQYNRPIADIVTLQNQIARDVSRKLRSRLSGAEETKVTKNYTENVEAFRLYLKGRYFWNKFTQDDHLVAAEYFKRAIGLDPNYALAYAGLADTYGASAANSWIPPKEGYLKAKAAVQKALELDNTLAQGHATLGGMYMFSDFDWNAAEKEYRRSVELDPNYELAHELYSYLLTSSGRSDEAIAESQRALELDPLSTTLSDDLGMAYFLAGRYQEAERQHRRTLEIEPDRPDSIYQLGNIYAQTGQYDEAIASYQRAMMLSQRSSNFLGGLGHAYAVAGRTNDARKVLSEMRSMSEHEYVSPYDLAIIYAGLGEKDKALEQLNQAFESRSGWIIHIQVDPFLDPLRDDPRFQRLIARAGF